MRPAFSAARPRSKASAAVAVFQGAAGGSAASRQKASVTHKIETRVRTEGRRADGVWRLGIVLTACAASSCAKLLGNGNDPAHSGARSDGVRVAVGDVCGHAGRGMARAVPDAAGAAGLDGSDAK